MEMKYRNNLHVGKISNPILLAQASVLLYEPVFKMIHTAVGWRQAAHSFYKHLQQTRAIASCQRESSFYWFTIIHNIDSCYSFKVSHFPLYSPHSNAKAMSLGKIAPLDLIHLLALHWAQVFQIGHSALNKCFFHLAAFEMGGTVQDLQFLTLLSCIICSSFVVHYILNLTFPYN